MEKIFGKWLPSSIWFSKDKMLQLSDSGSKPQWPKILCQWIWTSYDMLRLLAAGKVVHPSWRLQEFGRIAAGPRRMHGTRRSAEDKKKPRCFHSLSTVNCIYRYKKSLTSLKLWASTTSWSIKWYSPIRILPHILVPNLEKSDMFFRGSQFLVAGQSSFRIRRAWRSSQSHFEAALAGQRSDSFSCKPLRHGPVTV